MLALAQPAECEVIVTRKNIPLNGVTNTYQTFLLDINGDGVTDIQFTLADFQYHTDTANLGMSFPTGGSVPGMLAAGAGGLNAWR